MTVSTCTMATAFVILIAETILRELGVATWGRPLYWIKKTGKAVEYMYYIFGTFLGYVWNVGCRVARFVSKYLMDAIYTTLADTIDAITPYLRVDKIWTGIRDIGWGIGKNTRILFALGPLSSLARSL